ncbi:hypothetical protein [Francisella tularensis]|uniref:hypothetical protein n=1 Tax=Francisella tularensis TaxID=263 RepID=UPI0008F474BD|nr:hypothetical protein [Francisella tularensis]APA83270.1 hypothetical protein N894_1286 [Francisella tularensis subsp. novicida PA10-7858]
MIKKFMLVVSAVILLIILIIGSLFGIGYLYRNYNVWSSNMQGKSKLAYADQERQVMIAQAKSNLEAAKYNAEAEVEKAKGIAQSNQIIGQSLNDNPAYLTWKYYEVLEQTKNQVIYVSTQDNIPITESQRLLKHEVRSDE